MANQVFCRASVPSPNPTVKTPNRGAATAVADLTTTSHDRDASDRSQYSVTPTPTPRHPQATQGYVDIWLPCRASRLQVSALCSEFFADKLHGCSQLNQPLIEIPRRSTRAPNILTVSSTQTTSIAEGEENNPDGDHEDVFFSNQRFPTAGIPEIPTANLTPSSRFCASAPPAFRINLAQHQAQPRLPARVRSQPNGRLRLPTNNVPVTPAQQWQQIVDIIQDTEPGDVPVGEYSDDERVRYIVYAGWNTASASPTLCYFDGQDNRHDLLRDDLLRECPGLILGGGYAGEHMVDWMIHEGMLGTAWTPTNQGWFSHDHIRNWIAHFHRSFSGLRRRLGWTTDNRVFVWAQALGVRQVEVDRGMGYRYRRFREGRDEP